MPYLPYANGGAKCQYYTSSGVLMARLTVRPPGMWSLWNQTNQAVAWVVRFVNPVTGKTEPQRVGGYSTASPSQYTDFGGGPNAPQVFITSTEYWAGSAWVDRTANTTAAIKAEAEVYWQDTRTGLWTMRRGPSPTTTSRTPTSFIELPINGC